MNERVIFILTMLSFLLLPAGLLLTSDGWAGNSVGNGGGAWVCRDIDGKIESIDQVDLSEAPNLGVTLQDYDGPTDRIASEVEQGMVSASPQFFSHLSTYFDRLDFLKEGTPGVVFTNAPIPFINDAFFYESPPNLSCGESSGKLDYEQVVNYQDNGPITVQRELA